MWRPDNWDKIKPHEKYEDLYAQKYNAGVEEGADAMLKALKSDAIHFNAPGDYTRTYEIPKAFKGWVAFIPEEEMTDSV